MNNIILFVIIIKKGIYFFECWMESEEGRGKNLSEEISSRRERNLCKLEKCYSNRDEEK